MLDQSKSGANGEMTWRASLPMYCLPEMEAANSAFLAALLRRLRAKGIEAAETSFNSNHGAVSDSIGPGILFTQICGYPLL
jgi:hypothetical protein